MFITTHQHIVCLTPRLAKQQILDN